MAIFIKTKSGANIGLMAQDLNSRYQWKTDQVFERGKVYIEQFPTLYRLGTAFDYNEIYMRKCFLQINLQSRAIETK